MGIDWALNTIARAAALVALQRERIHLEAELLSISRDAMTRGLTIEQAERLIQDRRHQTGVEDKFIKVEQTIGRLVEEMGE